MIDIASFGMTPAGKEVHSYAISAGGVNVRLMDFGAAVLGVRAPGSDDTPADIALGFGSLEGYLDNPACHGCTVGPSANRTDRGEVPIAGTVYQLARNDGPARANNLHTDLDHGLHKRVWTGSVDERANSVTFTLELADSEMGLPGNRMFTVRYELAALEGGTGAELRVTHRCTTDAETFVNMTNHTYFNLAGHDKGTALDQLVRIEATRFLPLRADNISAGEMRSVTGTAFDFRKIKPLGRDIQAPDGQLVQCRGYDHCFCVDGFDRSTAATPRQALHAEDPSSGRMLDILITHPGAHLYTGNWLGDTRAKDGIAYEARAGFAFEPEFYPNNMHHAEWPHPICTPEQPFEQHIVYRFSHR